MNIKPSRLIFEQPGDKPKIPEMGELDLPQSIDPKAKLAELKTNVFQNLSPEKRQKLEEIQKTKELVDRKDSLMADMGRFESKLPDQIKRTVNVKSMQEFINKTFYACKTPEEKQSMLDSMSAAINAAGSMNISRDDLMGGADKVKQLITEKCAPIISKFTEDPEFAEKLTSIALFAGTLAFIALAGSIGVGVTEILPVLVVIAGVLAAISVSVGIYAYFKSNKIDALRSTGELDDKSVQFYKKDTASFLYDTINKIMPSITPEQLDQIATLQSKSVASSNYPNSAVKKFNGLMIAKIQEACEDGNVTEKEFESILHGLADHMKH